jgi:hypothetical protein
VEALAADFPAVPGYRQELPRSHNSLGNLLQYHSQLLCDGGQEREIGAGIPICVAAPRQPEVVGGVHAPHDWRQTPWCWATACVEELFMLVWRKFTSRRSAVRERPMTWLPIEES